MLLEAKKWKTKKYLEKKRTCGNDDKMMDISI